MRLIAVRRVGFPSFVQNDLLGTPPTGLSGLWGLTQGCVAIQAELVLHHSSCTTFWDPARAPGDHWPERALAWAKRGGPMQKPDLAVGRKPFISLWPGDCANRARAVCLAASDPCLLQLFNLFIPAGSHLEDPDMPSGNVCVVCLGSVSSVSWQFAAFQGAGFGPVLRREQRFAHGHQGVD